jgi:hypothetical protein
MKNFTKSFIALLTASIILLSVSAKAQSFEMGTSAINLGIGFGYSYGYESGAGVSQTPVISGSYEYGVTKLGPGTLGLGAQIAYQGASYSYTENSYNVSDNWTATLFGIRGIYHPDFCNGKNYDVYGALQLSYDHFGFSYTTNDPNPSYRPTVVSASSFYPYIIIGGRYYFTDNIGVWAELGYDLAYFNLGLSIKFGSSDGGGSGKK